MTELIPIHRQKLPASIEILPKQTPTPGELTTLLPRGTRVYLTDIGSSETEAEMLMAARRLREAGCVPVPHFAARRIASRAVLEKRIGRLAEEAGVADVMVIGGGVTPPAGPFASSMDLLETGLFDHYGITDLAIAGHPEGSPDFSEAVAVEALRNKKASAERTGGCASSRSSVSTRKKPSHGRRTFPALGSTCLFTWGRRAGEVHDPHQIWNAMRGWQFAFDADTARGQPHVAGDRLFTRYICRAARTAPGRHNRADSRFPLWWPGKVSAWLRKRGSWPPL